MIGKTSLSRKTFNVFNYSLMIGLSIIFILPLWHVIMSSISDPRHLIMTTNIIVKPLGEITFQGYSIVLKNQNILTGYMNTLIYVSGTTALGVMLTLLGGYVLSRKDLKLRIPLTAFFLFTMMFNGGLIPTYMVIKSLGMVGTRWALLIPGVTNAFFIIIMRSAFDQIPDSLEESAQIDGAKPLTVLIKVLAPLVKSTIAVIVLFNVVLQWNSWFPASIYIPTKRELWPLQLVMREVLVQNDSSSLMTAADAGDQINLVKNLVKYATVIVGTMPVLLIYPFLQKYFVKGVTLGAIKG